MSKRRSSTLAKDTRQVKVMMNKALHDRGKLYADRIGVSFSFLIEELLSRHLEKLGA